jgi:hypothetical protein
LSRQAPLVLDQKQQVRHLKETGTKLKDTACGICQELHLSAEAVLSLVFYLQRHLVASRTTLTTKRLSRALRQPATDAGDNPDSLCLASFFSIDLDHIPSKQHHHPDPAFSFSATDPGISALSSKC